MSLVLLALLFVGLVAFAQHFGGFALRWIRASRVRATVQAEHARIQSVLSEAEGAPDRPFVVGSPAVIEVRAGNLPCARCASRVRVDDHRAEVTAGRRARVVTTVCTRCAYRREVWFELEGVTH